jgi:hypothetical protein
MMKMRALNEDRTHMEEPEDKEDDENEILEGGQDAFSHPDLVKSIPTLIYWRSGRGRRREVVGAKTNVQAPNEDCGHCCQVPLRHFGYDNRNVPQDKLAD